VNSIQPVEIIKIEKNEQSGYSDLVVTEEPLEIRLGYGSESQRAQFTLSVTMRTPGNDEELCLGFLYSEDIISSIADVISVKYCDDLGSNEGRENVMRVELNPALEIDIPSLQRNFYTSSSCGVCGKASIESVQVHCEIITTNGLVATKDVLFTLPEKLRKAQQVFKHTGGLHASGLFNLQGELLVHKEDVGRHNALDKLLGNLLLKDITIARSSILMLSGRISFELVQKAVKARIPIIAAVGSPSSLAVDLANEFGVTLIGFLKENKFNIYTNEERILS